MDQRIPSPQKLHSAPGHHKSPSSKLRIIIFAILLLVSIAAGLLYRHLHASDSESSKQSLTLYYQDGSTVLWQSGQESNGNAAFVQYIKDQLQSKYGRDYQRGEWRVTTSLDKDLQQKAQDQIQAQRRNLAMRRVSNTAFIAEDVTSGQVVSWASDSTGAKGTDNVRAKTSVGTLAVPFNYAALLENSPSDATAVFDDKQGPLPGYPCINRNSPASGGNCLFNLDYKYLGPLSLRQALAGMRIVPAAQSAAKVGTKQVLHTMSKMGGDATCYLDPELKQETDCYLSASFGDGLYAKPQHMLQAYATLANSGRKLPQTTILKVAADGKPLYAWERPKAEQSISKTTAQTLSDILSDAEASFLTNKKDVFTTPAGTKVATIGGYTQRGEVSSAVQFSSKYAVGFWGSGQDMPGDVLRSAILPVTSAWISSIE